MASRTWLLTAELLLLLLCRLQISSGAAADAAPPIPEGTPSGFTVHPPTGGITPLVFPPVRYEVYGDTLDWCQKLWRATDFSVSECIVFVTQEARAHGFPLLETHYEVDTLARPDLSSRVPAAASEAYFSLLTASLSGALYPLAGSIEPTGNGDPPLRAYDARTRQLGGDWGGKGVSYTMAGHFRTELLRRMMETVLAENVPGDFLEAGIWRGGQSIFASLLWRWYGEGGKRRVYACDSFEGLPPASTPNDLDFWSRIDFLRVSLEEVRTAFAAYGVDDGDVEYVKGYFADTLPGLAARGGLTLSILRIDADMYEGYMDSFFARLSVGGFVLLDDYCMRSTPIDADMYEGYMDSFFTMYARLSVGGFVLLDDYCLYEARRAAHDFRTLHGITEPLRIARDGLGAYWRKGKHVQIQRQAYESLRK